MSSNWQNAYSSSHSTKKVFINPNFNKCVLPVQHSSTMHINPNFTQHIPQRILMNPNKNKIHVNPDFVKANYTNRNTHIVQNIQVQNIQSPNVRISNTLKIGSSLECNPGTLKPTCITPIQKSRYSLIRNVNKNVIDSNNLTRPVLVIKKISKYKLVSICDKKPHLEDLGPFKSKLTPSTPQNIQNKRTIFNRSLRSKFKYVKKGLIATPIINNHNKTLVKHKRPCLKSKIKILPGSLKKNNIPCPLFRKYGKCLRKLRGSCEFLHDKKHVAICRKFLKGICHDNDCLMSHDLTDKKMPTCYFYLKGMCTKEKCPYLHIKLNEKTKVCSDFLKGYCESGEQCLKRHVRLRSGVSKKKCVQSQNNKVKREQKYETSNVSRKYIEKSVEKSNEENRDEECRYYKIEDNVNNKSNEDSDVSIKPSRCKLGTLPSFIKL